MGVGMLLQTMWPCGKSARSQTVQVPSPHTACPTVVTALEAHVMAGLQASQRENNSWQQLSFSSVHSLLHGDPLPRMHLTIVCHTDDPNSRGEPGVQASINL